MRLGVVCSPAWGGSGVVATETALELGRRGHEVHVVSAERPVRLGYSSNVFFHEVSHDPYPFFHHHPYSLALASTLAEVISERNLDIVHVHYAMPHAISALLARQIHPDHPFKLVTTLHGTDITLVGQARSYFALTRLALERSDGVTAVSEWLAGETRRVFGVERDLRVIPNAIDLKRFHPGAGNSGAQFRAGLPAGRKVVTHISNFRPVKRVLDVVEVFARITRHEEAHLVLVGDGPDRGAVRERIRALGLESRTTFWGTQQNVEVMLAGSDLFLLPSEHESFGLAALEAMACGCPVVATAGSGMATFITSGQEGLLAPVGDVGALAAAALRILRDPEPFRRAGVTRAAGYDLRIGAGHYEKFYLELLGR